jgi:hypothetical protein
MNVDAAVAVEGSHPAVLLEPVIVERKLDKPARLEARRQTGLCL